jgi:hypothetical protein
MGTDIRVRGNATADELAVLLAALARSTARSRSPLRPVDGYRAWRAGRRRALADPPQPGRKITRR